MGLKIIITDYILAQYYNNFIIWLQDKITLKNKNGHELLFLKELKKMTLSTIIPN